MKIERLFYSIYTEHLNPISPFQIKIDKKYINQKIDDTCTWVQISDSAFVNAKKLDQIFFIKLIKLDIFKIPEFLEFHRDEYHGEIEDFIRNLKYIFNPQNEFEFTHSYSRENKREPHELWNHNVNELRSKFSEVRNWINEFNIEERVKLKWLGTPSQFGYVFLELAQKGYIEIPKTGYQSSFKKYARYCHNLFEINTTFANLEKELNPTSNSLTHANRNEFKIPSRS